MQKQLGEPVAGWQVPPAPGAPVLEERYVRLERLDADAHAGDLFRANAADDAIWDYLPYGPFGVVADHHAWVRAMAALEDPYFYALRNLETGHLGGVASYLRIAPTSGSIEVGHITLAPEMQRTRAATEAMYLMMRWVFEAGYRRYEWKCNALNLPSRRAAGRFGFSYEGVFRQAAVVKGRNRDTAWYAVIDKDWPALRAAFENWLAPANFDGGGRQRRSLADLTRPLRVSSDPAAAP